ncbi:MAG TPA: glycosyltransferase family 39 protein [Gemmataceae bacterium]|nr:glycosyltransferase family 39 protein [Gemmataceae bacterium]
MENQPFETMAQDGQPCKDAFHDLRWLLVLIAFAAGIRVWLICHTEVAARDSIGFVRYAVQLEKQPWLEVVRHSEQHPGYPFLVLAVSQPVRHFMDGTSPKSMQVSAQVASALAGVLLVIPMFYLGRALFDRRVAFWATLMFQCLPVAAHVLSDGLSEATFLLFMTTGLLCAVHALRTFSLVWFACCGLCGGLAYLTRPEGVLLPLAVLLVLPLAKLMLQRREGWKRAALGGASLAVTAIVVGSPFAFAIGGFTSKPTPKKILNVDADSSEDKAPDSYGRTAQQWDGVQGPEYAQATAAGLLAVYAPSELNSLLWWPFKAIGIELLKGYEYVLWAPLLLGVWLFRKQFRSSPGMWLMLVLCALDIALLWRLGKVVGYISDRHVLLLVLCGLYLAAAGCIRASEALAGFASSAWTSWRGGAAFTLRQQSWIALGLLMGMTMFDLPGALKTLHANRAGHRQAGQWLAQHSQPADFLLDPYCWAHYYSGRLFLEGTKPTASPGQAINGYIVIEHSKSDHIRLEAVPLAEEFSTFGKAVFHWPENVSEANAKILVYELNPEAQARAYKYVQAHPVTQIRAQEQGKRSKKSRKPEGQLKT